eukprot:5793-Pelagococcus_subviridis.AAC.1
MDGGEPRSLNKYPKEGKGSDTDRSISTRRGSVRNARRTSRRERKPSAGDEPEPFLGVEPLHLRARIGDDGDRCVESPAERGKIS